MTRHSSRRLDGGPRLDAGWASAAVLALLAACSRAPEPQRPGAAEASADSIVLERTVCFGFCPAYRLVIGASGEVRLEEREHPGPLGRRPDSLRLVAHERVSVAALDSLLAQARSLGFFSLPDEITPGNPAECSLAATDHSSAIVTIAIGDTVKRVNHYLGCMERTDSLPRAAFPELVALEHAIDSVAGVRTAPAAR